MSVRRASDGVDLVLDAHAELAEAPYWDVGESVLIWVDILQGFVHTLDPATGRDTSIAVGQPVGAAVPCEGGGFAVAVRDGLGFLSGERTVELVANTQLESPGTRMNDAKCDPVGRLWAGTMALDGTAGAGSLYRWDPTRGVERILTGCTISNGLGWSPGGDVMYFIDSPTRGVDAFEYDLSSGRLLGRRTFVAVPEEDGIPDGLAVDSAGGVWVALPGGWSVNRYLPDGQLDLVFRLPVSTPTSVAFGGADFGDLFVTSATYGLSEGQLADEPMAGGILRCRPGVIGLPPTPFAGSPSRPGRVPPVEFESRDLQ